MEEEAVEDVRNVEDGTPQTWDVCGLPGATRAVVDSFG
jgi:hypothetical protein